MIIENKSYKEGISKNKYIEIPNRIVIAPQAGFTNLAFRKIMKRFNAGLLYTEMISAKGLLYENDKTYTLCEIDSQEHPVSLQLFGGEKEDLVKAAMIIDKGNDCDIIDFNMGCPIKKVLRSDSGSKMMLDIEKTADIVRAVVANVSKPVSVKFRAGWDRDNINCVEFAKAMEKAGASIIAIHGRTKSDLYAGECNLDYIKDVKEAVSIPVIGNGDIKSIEDAQRMFQYTNCDMVMIGRGCVGNPWLIRDLVDYFDGKEIKSSPTASERIKVMCEHYEELLKIKSEKIATMEMRSLASRYIKGVSSSKDFKIGLIKCTTKKEFYENIEENLLKDEFVL